MVRYALPDLRKVGKPFGQAQLSGPKAKVSDAGHKGEILCLAASEDGKWLVTGGRDKVVGVWNVEGEEPKWITGMRGHKDAITVRPFGGIPKGANPRPSRYRLSTIRRITSLRRLCHATLPSPRFLRCLSSTHSSATRTRSPMYPR